MAHPYYHLASRHIGRPAEVVLRDGRRYRGVVTHVTPTHLHMRPLGAAVAGEANDTPIKAVAAVQREVEKGTEILFPFIFPFAALAAFSPFFWW